MITIVIGAAVAALLFVYPVQAGTGRAPGGGNTTVTSNYDGKHGEKVTTTKDNADGSTTVTSTTYDAYGNKTGSSSVTGGPSSVGK